MEAIRPRTDRVVLLLLLFPDSEEEEQEQEEENANGICRDERRRFHPGGDPTGQYPHPQAGHDLAEAVSSQGEVADSRQRTHQQNIAQDGRTEFDGLVRGVDEPGAGGQFVHPALEDVHGGIGGLAANHPHRVHGPGVGDDLDSGIAVFLKNAQGFGRLQGFGERAELEADNQFYREAIALSKLRS